MKKKIVSETVTNYDIIKELKKQRPHLDDKQIKLFIEDNINTITTIFETMYSKATTTAINEINKLL